MKYYLSSVEETLNLLRTSKDGLSEDNAKKRLFSNGPNKLAEKKGTSTLAKFLKQLSDPMIIVLIFAAVISAGISIYSKESFTDFFIIAFVVAVNAALGVYQENKAEKAISALNEMSPSFSKVVRDGQVMSLKSENLVVGDIVILEAGDAVPADVRIIESHNLKVEESALTGEPLPIDKISEKLCNNSENEVALSERKNMAYMGCNVVYGRGKAVVVKTGMATEMGKIATFIDSASENKTPLQIKLTQLSKILSFAVIGICAFIFAFRILITKDFTLPSIINTFMIAISLAVAAIPEGLATVVTIQLAIGMTKMAKHNAIVRKLTAVETLGCTQIICSDKTGTLTQNKMTVVKTFCDNEKLFSSALALCNDASIENIDKPNGDPTEIALLNYAKDFHSIDKLKTDFPRVNEAPFSSERKMMSTIHSSDNKFVQFTKGAPDVVLNYCTKFIENGKVLNLTEQKRNEILNENNVMASNALRVLAAGCKYYDSSPTFTESKEIENELIFLGLCGMIDPVREEAIDAVKECKSAGIRPIMITGDYKDTAATIAKELGIIKHNSEVITACELDKFSEKELPKVLERYSVYARVQPEHKVKIVKAFKSLGKVVAMTGDGVNDAPSLKIADIGIGMGITGTDVTKSVADMVLADDNFATIVTAVKEGRRIYSNIQKSIQFLISSNISEVLSIFIATVLNFSILSPIHILWINLITDTFPALSLGMEKEESNLMKSKPRPANEGIFANGLSLDITYQGILISIIALASYFIGHYLETKTWAITNSSHGTTMAFLTMSLSEIFHSLNLRSSRQSIFKLKSHNLYLWATFIISFVLTNLVIYVPFLANIFEIESIDFIEYSVAILLSVSVIPAVELVKLLQRKHKSTYTP